MYQLCTDIFCPGTSATVHQNPPVTLTEWHGSASDMESEDASDIDDVPSDSPDQDPPYIELTEPLREEPEFTHEEAHAMLQAQLGDMDRDLIDLCTSHMLFHHFSLLNSMNRY